MKMSNNPDIHKISLIFQNDSNNILQNDLVTDSYNFIDESTQNQDNNENNSNNISNEIMEEKINSYQKYLEEYNSIEEEEKNSKHFVFVGESYSKVNINEIIDNNNNNNNNFNNNNKNIKKKKEEKKFLTEDEIKKTCLIKSNSHYVVFQNNYGENSCYINVVLHVLFSRKTIFDYLVEIYKDWIKNDKQYKEQMKNIDKNDEEGIKKLKQLQKRELMSYLGEILYKYKEALYSKNRVSILSTFDFRKKLSKLSNGFALNYVGDPVEFINFILEILYEMDNNMINDNFYLNIKEEYFCPKCNNKNEQKYDKTTFVHAIYVEEVLNYLNTKNKKIKDYKHNLCYANKLFLSAQLCYINTSKKCPKNHEMEKKIICNNFPNYLMINCVWNHKPNIDKVLEFFTLLSLKNKFNDLFEVPPQKKKNLKYLNYDLTHIILYSSSLYHYIIIIYNPILKIFNIYDDSKVIECDSLLQAFEIITSNLLSQNSKYYFYPVLLIYSIFELYKDENLVNKNQLNDKSYDYLFKKCKNSIKFFENEMEKKRIHQKKKNNINNNKINNNNNNINNNNNTQKEKRKEENKKIEKKQFNKNMDNNAEHEDDNNSINKDKINEETKKITNIEKISTENNKSNNNIKNINDNNENKIDEQHKNENKKIENYDKKNINNQKIEGNRNDSKLNNLNNRNNNNLLINNELNNYQEAKKSNSDDVTFNIVEIKIDKKKKLKRKENHEQNSEQKKILNTKDINLDNQDDIKDNKNV